MAFRYFSPYDGCPAPSSLASRLVRQGADKNEDGEMQAAEHFRMSTAVSLSLIQEPPQPARPSPKRPALSPRELEVLGHIQLGLTNREIAQRLFVSTNTVNKHVQQVLRKLAVSNRVQAAMYSHGTAS